MKIIVDKSLYGSMADKFPQIEIFTEIEQCPEEIGRASCRERV